MKKYLFLAALAISVVSQTSLVEGFEIFQEEIKDLIKTKSYQTGNSRYLLVSGDYTYLEYLLDLQNGIKAEVTLDEQNPDIMTIQCLAPKMEVDYKPISMEEAYSYDENFAKRYIVYRYLEGRYIGGYYLRLESPAVDINGPIFEAIGTPMILNKEN